MTILERATFLVVLLFAATAEPVPAADYHFDSVAGDDVTGDGSLAAPWKSLSQLSTVALAPGNWVLLKRGSVFRERLTIEDSGVSGAPIIVDAYDTGVAPIVSAGFSVPEGAAWSGPDTAGEYSLTLGPTLPDFYTSAAAVVRAQPTGTDSYRLLALGTAGALSDDTYTLTNVAGQRTLVYRPPAGSLPGDFEFEVSRRNYAILVSGDWVTVRNIEGVLGNQGHATYDSPVLDATIVSLGSHVVFENCRAAFGRSFGIAVAGPDSLIDGCLAEHNHSTGLYIQGAGAADSTIRHSVSRFNGNLEFQDLDRGGIGVQADFAVIRNNVIHDNGNIADMTGPRIAGDDAISLFDNHGAIIENNFVYNSARSAIGMSWTAGSYGHRIAGNVIANWNLSEQTGTARTQAISVFAFGNTADSGNFEILNNTIYSGQVHTTLIGIQLGLPTNSDALRDTAVLNNIVYMPNNVAVDSFGLRLTRESLFDNVNIDFNDVLLSQSGSHYSAFAGVFSTASDFYTALGFELNGLNADPQFAAFPVDPEDPLSFDLVLSSPLVDVATDVGMVGDFIGRSIPSGLGPDIGAFEVQFQCPDADGDGVCNEDDVCPDGPLVVEGLLSPMGPLTPDTGPTILPDRAFKQKRTLPLKLRLLCGGVSLTGDDIDPPAIVALTRTGEVVNLPETDLDAGNSNDNGLLFRYADPNWIYNLDTSSLETGSYEITIVTPEGLACRAAFVVK